MLSPKYILDYGESHVPTYRERKPQAWSRFYHGDYLLAFPMETIARIIWSDSKISLGLWDGVKSLPSRETVSWDSNKTQIQSANLVVSASVIQYAWPGGSCGLAILMNGVKAAEKSWLAADISPYSARVDVSSYLRNGLNEFEAKFDKLPVLIGDRVLNISATLEITYGGEVPPDPPWWENLINWVTEHPLETAAAASIGMVAVGGVMLLKKKKR